MRFLLISAALALAPPAWADPGEGAPDARAPVLACVAAAGINEAAVRACQGAGAQPCHEAVIATQDMVLCAAGEGQAWDEVIAQSLARLSAGAPDRASALTDAQAAWSAYRARECGYRVARWGEGSGARVVLASCMAQMSADRAVDLIAYEQEEEGSLALRRE
ncbi:MAG TPA: lysozyme inhibitor LprI family protein [Terricaulis sp.]|nr:lysozyme inhibitor LprI family protein [Terricaulis sp.]